MTTKLDIRIITAQIPIHFIILPYVMTAAPKKLLIVFIKTETIAEARNSDIMCLNK